MADETNSGVSEDSAGFAAMPANDTENRLPPLYNNLVPLSTQQHGDLCFNPTGDFSFAAKINAVPLAAEEFPVAQHYFPILFTQGDQPQPLAILGLRENENLFVSADGKWKDGVYIPAYVRRYPFMLARLAPNDERMSLCIDDTAAGVSRGAETGKIFEGEQPSQATKDILAFCEQLDTAGQRTKAFTDRVAAEGLFTEEDTQLQTGNKPIRIRGLRNVKENFLEELAADKLQEFAKANWLAVIYAHLFSVQQLRELMRLTPAAASGG